jgi:hypothetical protein
MPAGMLGALDGGGMRDQDQRLPVAARDPLEQEPTEDRHQHGTSSCRGSLLKIFPTGAVLNHIIHQHTPVASRPRENHQGGATRWLDLWTGFTLVKPNHRGNSRNARITQATAQPTEK